MNRQKNIYMILIILVISSLACSISSTGRQIQSANQTVSSVRTQVGGAINFGSSMLQTAQAIATSHPHVLETAQALVTQAAPAISTIQSVATYNPGFLQTAQAAIGRELPTGEPPTDVPILSQDQVYNFFGSSQYIFYTTPTQYPQVLDFYQTKMPDNGWQFQAGESHEYAHAAELVYTSGSRTATINLSLNPLNQTSVVVITILNQ
jgi:hypothetical protein